MNKVIKPSRLGGAVNIQPSKSVTHRAVICASLARGNSELNHFMMSKDIEATLGCVDTLWIANYALKPDACVIEGNAQAGLYNCTLDCKESGSTLRFFIPLALVLCGKVNFTGSERLFERPLAPLKALFESKGVKWEQEGNRLTLEGRLKGGDYEIEGNVSSQYISGLLFALPLLSQDSVIRLKTPLESAGYVELTRQMQENFGVISEWKDGALLIRGGQKYYHSNIVIEGDYSHAAFYAVAGALGGDIVLYGLEPDSLQGDRAILDILSRMGANVETSEYGIRVTGGELCGIDIDAKDIPDLVPVLSVAACGACGITRIYNASRLRLKESDRLSAMCRELQKLGAKIEQTEDGLIINGNAKLHGGSVDAHNDHRIAMSLAVASAVASADIELFGAESVAKSAPDFWSEFEQLGGKTL